VTNFIPAHFDAPEYDYIHVSFYTSEIFGNIISVVSLKENMFAGDKVDVFVVKLWFAHNHEIGKGKG
jgi:hypothetical protein